MRRIQAADAQLRKLSRRGTGSTYIDSFLQQALAKVRGFQWAVASAAVVSDEDQACAAQHSAVLGRWLRFACATASTAESGIV